jgi:hypothetical protein
MKNQNKENQNIILKSCIGCLIAILLVSVNYSIYNYYFNYKTIESIERLDVKETTIVSVKGEIFCEEGVDIVRSLNKDEKTIYGCLHLIRENGIVRCSGEGKICLIKTKERIRK